jgi:hypothetical protein
MKTGTRTRETSPSIRDAVVVAWRLEQLLGAGFDLDAGERLSRDCGVDLHAVLDLIEQGCPPALAELILAPVDGESRSC